MNQMNHWENVPNERVSGNIKINSTTDRRECTFYVSDDTLLPGDVVHYKIEGSQM